MAEEFKTCRSCKGTGEVRSCDKDASPATKMSGEIMVEPGRSVCAKCHGCGVKYSKEPTSKT